MSKLDNESLQDYVNRLGQQGQGQVAGGFNPDPFKRPSDLGGPVGPVGPVTFGQIQMRQATPEDRIYETFRTLAQLVAALPENDHTKAAKRSLVIAGSDLAAYFIEKAFTPGGT